MGKLLRVNCVDCPACCPAIVISADQLAVIKAENREIYNQFIRLDILFVFCPREDYFAIININL